MLQSLGPYEEVASFVTLKQDQRMSVDGPLMTYDVRKLYRFILADFAIQAQVLRNSIRHDLRFAKYLSLTASVRDRTGLDTLARSLERLEHQLDLEVMRRLEVPEETPLTQEEFIELRSSVARDYRMLLEQTGVVIGDLEALVGRLPPGSAEPWTRLETVDATHVKSLVKVARDVSTRLSTWLHGGEHTEKSLISIEFAFRDEVYAYDAAPQGDGPAGHPSLQMAQAILVPLSVAFTPRYGPVLVTHEVCHGWVRRWVDRQEDPHHRHAYAEIADRYLRRDTTPDQVRDFADELFVETLIDELGLRLLGPSYLLAVASWTLGRSRALGGPALDHAAPLGVRLRRLCDRARQAGHHDRYLGALQAIEEDLVAYDRSLDPWPLLQEYRGAVSELVAREDWLPDDLNRAIPPEGPRLNIASTVEDLWSHALALFVTNPERRHLAQIAEVRTIDMLRGSNRWPDGVVEDQNRTWRLLYIHVRPHATFGPHQPGEILEQVTAMFRPEPGEIVRTALGSSDVIAFRRGARVREDDEVAPIEGLELYVERRIAARVISAEALHWAHPRAPEADEALLLVEMRLARREPGVLLKDVVCSPVDGSELIQCFRGFGWAHLIMLFSVRTPYDCIEQQNTLLRLGTDSEHITQLVPHILLPRSPSCVAGESCTALTQIDGSDAARRMIDCLNGADQAPRTILHDAGAVRVLTQVRTWEDVRVVCDTAASVICAAGSGRSVTRLMKSTKTVSMADISR